MGKYISREANMSHSGTSGYNSTSHQIERRNEQGRYEIGFGRGYNRSRSGTTNINNITSINNNKKSISREINDNRVNTYREQHTIINRVLFGGSISAGFLLLFLLITPMLLKWESIWGNRHASNTSDIYGFYYNDSYTIQLADGTEKIIEYYNPEAEEESVYIEEVNTYTELRDIYTYSDSGNDTIESVEDVLKSLNRVMIIGRKVYDKVAQAVDFVDNGTDWEIFDTPWGYLKNLWNWISDPFN